MNRRGFLALIASAGLAAAAATTGLGRTALKVAQQAIPILYGDGRHDDTAALQAYLSGERVEHDGKLLGGHQGEIYLPQGDYQVFDTLKIEHDSVKIIGSSFTRHMSDPTKPIFRVNAATCPVRYCVMDTA